MVPLWVESPTPMKLIAALFATFAWFPVPATTSAVLPQEWAVDGMHSSVVFKVRHADTASFYGCFTKVSGTVSMGDDLAAAKIAITIAADSVDTRDAGRDKHLKGPDFFDTKQFPDITFASTKVAKDGDMLAVDGELTMRGVKKPLSVKVSRGGNDQKAGFETTFTVKRSDFGINYGLAKNGIGDEVTLMISLECAPPKAAK